MIEVMFLIPWETVKILSCRSRHIIVRAGSIGNNNFIRRPKHCVNQMCLFRVADHRVDSLGIGHLELRRMTLKMTHLTGGIGESNGRSFSSLGERR